MPVLISVPRPELATSPSQRPPPSIACFPTFFFLCSGNEARRRRVMSSSTSASRQSWTQYGPLPLTRCPDCPRMEPLKRLTCVREENGNRGREFVKCLSKPQPGQVRSVLLTNPMVSSLPISFFFPRIRAADLGGGSRIHAPPVNCFSGSEEMWAF